MTDEIKQHEGGEPIGLGERFEPVDWQAQPSLFAKRVKVFPKRVSGFFRNIKWGFMSVLLGIYYLLPWLRWERGPVAPDQAVLFDIASRRFYFFGIEIWPQEVYILVAILIGSAFGLFFVTSLIGRAWCAWGCPQTVWTDLFMLVERKVEGDRNARMRLDKAPWTLDKITKRAIKHGLWLIIAALTGGAWSFYFMDAPTLARGIFTLVAPMAAWSTIGILTLMTYVMAGFAREQVCTYMCPYSRFQSAMMDKDTFMIAYRADRGEPRAKYKRGTSFEGRGHCIRCTQCVSVCPMGIDIRNGMQLECINCGLCADACDNVMRQVGLPEGLIGYDSLDNVDRRARGLPERPFSLLRPRTIVYFAALGIVGLMLIAMLVMRSDSGLSVIHDRNPVFVQLSNGDIRNGYRIKILNKAHDARTYQLSIQGFEGALMELAGGQTEFVEALDIHVPPNEVREVRLYVRQGRQSLQQVQTNIVFEAKDLSSGRIELKESRFMGPEVR